MPYDKAFGSHGRADEAASACEGTGVHAAAAQTRLLRIRGTFSVKMSQISEQMVDEKVACVEETAADVLIGADCGCLMNIGGRIGRKNKPIEVMHIAEVLNSR